MYYLRRTFEIKIGKCSDLPSVSTLVHVFIFFCNYQDQPGTSSSSKSVEVQHQPKITLSEKTGLIEIEGTINNGQDDQENDDNTGVNDLHQSDAVVNSGAPEDGNEKNEGHNESRNDDEVFDEQPGTSAQSFGQPQEGKNKGRSAY